MDFQYHCYRMINARKYPKFRNLFFTKLPTNFTKRVQTEEKPSYMKTSHLLNEILQSKQQIPSSLRNSEQQKGSFNSHNLTVKKNSMTNSMFNKSNLVIQSLEKLCYQNPVMIENIPRFLRSLVNDVSDEKDRPIFDYYELDQIVEQA